MIHLVDLLYIKSFLKFFYLFIFIYFVYTTDTYITYSPYTTYSTYNAHVTILFCNLQYLYVILTIEYPTREHSFHNRN